MFKQFHLIVGTFVLICCCAGCSTAPRTTAERESLQTDVRFAIEAFQERDPSMKDLFDESYGYAVFPSVVRGGAGFGGAYGRGIVFEQGNMIGYCDLSQGSVGFQLGGQSYRQVIFFQYERSLRRFTSGQFAFAAQASAVAAHHGASADADFSEGVIVFTMTKGGLMYEASIGGQNFDFVPSAQVKNAE